MEIRNATIADLPQIVEIYNSTIASGVVTADTEPVTVESRVRWFEEHNQTTRPIWVGVNPINQEIIGWLSFNDFYGRAAYNITAEISLYIHEMYRNKGYATFLLQKAINEAPGMGLQQLLGFIFSSNTQSINLFKKHHFEVWGDLKKVAMLHQKSLDLLIMGLSL